MTDLKEIFEDVNHCEAVEEQVLFGPPPRAPEDLPVNEFEIEEFERKLEFMAIVGHSEFVIPLLFFLLMMGLVILVSYI